MTENPLRKKWKLEPFEEYLSHIQVEKSKSTYQNAKVAISQFQDFCEDWSVHPIEHNDYVTIDYFREYLVQSGYSGDTVANKVYRISHFYKQLKKRGVVDENPVEDYNVNKYRNKKSRLIANVDRIHLTDNEYQQLLNACSNKRDEFLIQLMWHTGVRALEASKITESDIDFDEGAITVQTAKQNDETVTRTVFPAIKFVRILKKWVENERDAWLGDTESDYIVASKSGEKIHPSTINQIVRDTAIDAGINEVAYTNQAGIDQYKFSSHSLRHSFAVRMTENGCPIVYLQEILGHSDIEQTRTYLEFRDDDIKQAMRRYS